MNTLADGVIALAHRLPPLVMAIERPALRRVVDDEDTVPAVVPRRAWSPASKPVPVK